MERKVPLRQVCPGPGVAGTEVRIQQSTRHAQQGSFLSICEVRVLARKIYSQGTQSAIKVAQRLDHYTMHDEDETERSHMSWARHGDLT